MSVRVAVAIGMTLVFLVALMANHIYACLAMAIQIGILLVFAWWLLGDGVGRAFAR